MLFVFFMSHTHMEVKLSGQDWHQLTSCIDISVCLITPPNFIMLLLRINPNVTQINDKPRRKGLALKI